MPEELQIRAGNRGLITNFSAVDSDRESFRVLKNFTVDREGIIRSVNGNAPLQLEIVDVFHPTPTLMDVPALPAGFTPEEIFCFHIAIPTEAETGYDALLVFGNLDSRDRFYVWPGPQVWGTFSLYGDSDWLELTEAETATVDVVSSTTEFTIAGLAQSSDQYYLHWIIWNNNRTAYDYVSNQSGSSFTTKFGITSVTAGDALVLMRFPIFKKGTSIDPMYQIDGLPTFSVHGNAVTIHTGMHDINRGPDLWLSFLSKVTNGATDNKDWFANDTALSYGGWHFDFAHVFRPRDTDVLATVAAAGSSTDPFPWTSGSEYYIVDVTALYDDLQESRVRVYNKDSGSPKFVAITAADQDIDVTLAVNYRTDLVHESDYATGTSVPTVWSRRITKLRLYIANATLVDSGSSEYQPNSDFFFVREIDINDVLWSLSGGQYQITVTIGGTDYREAQGLPFSAVNGYVIQQTGANAKFEAQVGNRTVIGPIFDDTEKVYRALFSPLQVAGAPAPNVFPVRFRIDPLQYVPEIVALVEHLGRLIIFGRNTFVVCSVTGEDAGSLVESLQKVGCISYRTIKSVDGRIFFSSPDNILEIFDGNNVANPGPGYAIKNIWDDLSQDEKRSAFSGYHRKQRRYVIQVAERVFVFEARFGTWFEYVPESLYTSFTETFDGRLIGINDNGIYDLFADSPEESLVCTLEPQVYDGSQALYRRQRLRYKSNTLLKCHPIDDAALSTLQVKSPTLFAVSTEWQKKDFSIGVDTHRFTYRIESSEVTAPDIEIESLAVKRMPMQEF